MDLTDIFLLFRFRTIWSLFPLLYTICRQPNHDFNVSQLPHSILMTNDYSGIHILLGWTLLKMVGSAVMLFTRSPSSKHADSLRP